MLRPRTPILSLALLLASSAFACADDLADLARPQHGVLVMRGGQVLEGEITQAGDHYYLTLPTGEISIRAAEVAYRCEDLGAAYERQRDAINPARIDERMKLIEWCLQYDLYGPAAREIASAKEQWPDEPRVAALERRMLLRDQTAKSVEKADAHATEPSLTELDQMVRELPPRAVAMFTSTIQPLLLNHCSTAACHGANRSNDFGLQRSNAARTPARRLTLRNLGHTLTQVDRNHPEASRLLTQPSGLEQSSHPIIFDDANRSAQEQLVAWVKLLAGGDEPQESPLAGSVADSALLQFAPTGAAGASPSQDASAKSSPSRQAVFAGDAQNSPRNSPPVAVPSFSTKQRGGLVRPDGSYDPLDPDVFNRRHFPERFEVKFFNGHEIEPAAEQPDVAE